MNSKLLTTQEPALLAMPLELRLFTLQNCVSASPYNRGIGGSFYSNNKKTWNYTEDRTIRVSDHWNFYSQGTTHCITDLDNSKIAGQWVVAEYRAETGMWHVISADQRDLTALEKRNYRIGIKSFQDQLITIKRDVRARHAAAIRRMEKRKAKQKAENRLADIKGGFIFHHGYVTDYGRRAGGYYWSVNENVNGMVYSESACRTNGRKVNSYYEIDLREFLKEISPIKNELAQVMMMPDYDTYKNCIKPEIVVAVEKAELFGMKNEELTAIKKTLK